jgi:hypothetical protein
MMIPEEKQIMRFDPATKGKRLDTLVLIGNGCVQGGWEPLKQILEANGDPCADDPILALILNVN